MYAPAWGGGLYCLLHIVPRLHYVFSGNVQIFAGGSIVDYDFGSYIDAVFLLTWLAGYAIVIGRSRINLNLEINKEEIGICKVIVALACISMCYSLYRDITTHSIFYGFYQKMVATNIDAIRFTGIERSPYEFGYAVLGALYVLHIRGNPTIFKNSRLFFVGIVVLLLGETFLAMQGGPLLKLAGISIIVFYLGNRTKSLVFILISICLFTVIARGIMEEGRNIRYLIKNENQVDVLNASIESMGRKTEKFVESAAGRMDYSSASGVLARWTESIGYAGFYPYYTLLFVPIPRAIWPDKPIPNSADGTYFSLPEPIAQYAMGGDIMSTAAVGAGGVCWWEGGFGGVVIGGVISGILMGLFIRRLAGRNGFWWLVLTISATAIGLDILRAPNVFLFNYYNKGFVLLCLYFGSRILVRFSRTVGERYSSPFPAVGTNQSRMIHKNMAKV